MSRTALTVLLLLGPPTVESAAEIHFLGRSNPSPPRKASCPHTPICPRPAAEGALLDRRSLRGNRVRDAIGGTSVHPCCLVSGTYARRLTIGTPSYTITRARRSAPQRQKHQDQKIAKWSPWWADQTAPAGLHPSPTQDANSPPLLKEKPTNHSREYIPNAPFLSLPHNPHHALYPAPHQPTADMKNLTAGCARVILTQITNTSFVEACEIAADVHASHGSSDDEHHHGHGHGHGHGHDMMEHVEHYTPSAAMNGVLFVVALLSFLASLVIVLSCKFMRSLRYYRHKVLPGLATSDMLLSLNFLFSTGFQMGGRVINQEEHPKLCSTSGFLTQLFVVQTDYWAITIAINTWVMVGWGGKHAKFIHDSVGVIWAIPWLLSITCASVSLAFVGYGDVGAWCWFQNDGMSLFINYIPRWFIVFVIMTIYISLFRYITKSSDFDTDDMDFHRRIRARDDTMVRGGGESFAEAPVNYQATEKDLRAASFRMMKYPLAWAVVWIIPTCVHVYHASGEQWGTPQWLTILEKACVASQGLIHCIVFSITEDVWEHVGDNWISMGGVTEMSWNREVDEDEMYRHRSPDTVALPPMAGRPL